MKYYFIDTNIILDLVAQRQPFCQDAEKLFQLAKENSIGLYCSAISINNIYYIIAKFSNKQTALTAIRKLRHELRIIDLDKKCLFKAMDSEFSDFEDAIQYYSATTIDKIAAIVTRNIKDFKQADIPVITPDIAVLQSK
jgi:predicted nucleic acid-binding protein